MSNAIDAQHRTIAAERIFVPLPDYPMKPLLSRILLPITDDPYFAQAGGMALQLAEDFGAEITLLVIDDDSGPYETVSLPFHDGDFVANVQTGEDPSRKSLGDRLGVFRSDAAERKIAVGAIQVRGHTATQVLLTSRFYDLIVTSGGSWFGEGERTATQRVNPLIEVLDQTVVPLLLAGTAETAAVNSAAVLFDGGPCATLALHALAALLINRPETPIHARVSLIEESVAQVLAEDCEKFLKSKGYTNVVSEYSPLAPMDAVTVGDFSPVDLSALGIRSRNTFHDLHVGVLAKHLIQNPQSGHSLFC
jgi:hypothetical protein